MTAIVKTKSTDKWSKQLDETSEEYLQFQEWLQSPDRPPLAGDLAIVAVKHDWAERSNCYDVADALAQNPALQVRSALKALTGLFMLEANKLVQRSAEAGPNAVLEPKELTQLANSLVPFIKAQSDQDIADQHQEQAARALSNTGTEDDLSDCTDEELEQIRAALALMDKRKR